MTQINAATATQHRPAAHHDSSAYVIQHGDTLSQIAARHGTTVDALMRANPQIHDADRIDAGDTLHLPAGVDAGGAAPQGSAVHVVRPGETLSQLARSANTDVATLARLNGIADPNMIHVGERVILPRGSVSSSQGGSAAAGSTAQTSSGGKAGWMKIARGEMGQKEIAGARDNARIVEYHQSTTLHAKDDETPWCSSFVNWTLEKAGFKGTDSAAAISWKNWGDKVDGLKNGREGDVVVIRNRATGQEHVGFLVGSDNGSFTLLGGNQSDQVKESTYKLSSYDIVAVRRPPGGGSADGGGAAPGAQAPAAPTTAAAGAGQRGISEADYASAARQLGVDVAAIKAVADVESAGSGMLPSGKPKILFEAHVFHQQTGGRYDGSYPNLSSSNWNRSLYGAGGEHQWQRFEQASKLDPAAAMKSASWGRFQIMGFNHQRAGFDNVQAFVTAMKSGEGAQLKAFASFIQSDPKMLQALRNHDWAAFAQRYNGSGYAQNQYDTKMAQAYAKFAH
jgi:uncharacterized protein (TIGR02594 family)